MSGTDPQPAPEPDVNNPPYVPPHGGADEPPPVPAEPVPDPATKAYLDTFAKPADPRDPPTSELTPGELSPSSTGEGGDTPAPVPPVNVDVPVVTQDGAALNCTMGNWNGVPETYAYAWASAGLDLGAGDSSGNYPLIVADVGQSYSCTVTATNAAGSTVAPSSNEVTVVAWTA